jgi:hypothetical protein
MWKRVKTWWEAWGAMVQLQGLDKRLMADMGLEREGLRARVMGKTAANDPEQVGDDGAVCAGGKARLKPAEPLRDPSSMRGERRGPRPVRQKIGPA